MLKGGTEYNSWFSRWLLPGKGSTLFVVLCVGLISAAGGFLLTRHSFSGSNPQLFRGFVAMVTTYPEVLVIVLSWRLSFPTALSNAKFVMLTLYLMASGSAANLFRAWAEPYDLSTYMNPAVTTLTFKVLWGVNNFIFFANVGILLPFIYWYAGRQQKQLDGIDAMQEVPIKTGNGYAPITVGVFVLFTFVAKMMEMINLDLTSVIAGTLIPTLISLYIDRDKTNQKPYVVLISILSIGIPIVLGWTMFQFLLTASTLGLGETGGQLILLGFWTVFMTFLRFVVRHAAKVAITPSHSLLIQTTIQWTEDLFTRLLFVGNLTDFTLYSAVGWNLLRSYMRMTGLLHFKVLEVFVWFFKKRRVRSHERALLIKEQMAIAEVVCGSELLASILVPVLLLADILLPAGFGEATLTYNMPQLATVLISLGILGILQIGVFPLAKATLKMQFNQCVGRQSVINLMGMKSSKSNSTGKGKYEHNKVDVMVATPVVDHTQTKVIEIETEAEAEAESTPTPDSVPTAEEDLEELGSMSDQGAYSPSTPNPNPNPNPGFDFENTPTRGHRQREIVIDASKPVVDEAAMRRWTSLRWVIRGSDIQVNWGQMESAMYMAASVSLVLLNAIIRLSDVRR